jgi:hypothetical protein
MSSDDMFESSVSSAFDADERRRIAGAVELVHLRGGVRGVRRSRLEVVEEDVDAGYRYGAEVLKDWLSDVGSGILD